MAIDVVHQQEESFLADYGYTDPRIQLQVLAGITVAIWVLESLFQYFYGVLSAYWWRTAIGDRCFRHFCGRGHKAHAVGFRMRHVDCHLAGDDMGIVKHPVERIDRPARHAGIFKC